jgi:hypothetical protein
MRQELPSEVKTEVTLLFMRENPMSFRMTAPRRLTVAAFALGLAGMIGVAATGQVAAEGACSNKTVEGQYALQARGLTEGLAHHTANLGRIVADGEGHLTGSLTVSINGRIATAQALNGTYEVHSDCTGVELFTIGLDPTPRTASFVVANRARQIDFLETDEGTVFSGTAVRQ